MKKIFEWIVGADDHHMFWLNGLAGAGKSALAQSIAERCALEGTLAASFFFSREEPGRRTMKHFFATISYQLSSVTSIIDRPILEKSLKKNPSVLTQSLHDQLHALIIRPLDSFALSNSPMVIIVDALDECRDEDSAKELISLLAAAFHKHQFPLRFLFTSRPEPHILRIFTDPDIESITRSLALEEFDPQANVRTFLQCGFDEIYQKHLRLMHTVPQPWPLEDDLASLVRQSSGLFTYASTLLNFIDADEENPNLRLSSILAIERSPNTVDYAALDRLYKQIFSLSPYSSRTRLIIGTILLMFEPLPLDEIEHLLGLGNGDGWATLRGLNFVFILPNEHKKPVRVFHGSLHNFLTNPQRSTTYFINPSKYHFKIGRLCLELMTNNLRRDVGNIEDPLSNSDSHKLSCGYQCIDGALRYACRYWAEHLSLVYMDHDIFEDLICGNLHLGSYSIGSRH